MNLRINTYLRISSLAEDTRDTKSGLSSEILMSKEALSTAGVPSIIHSRPDSPRTRSTQIGNPPSSSYPGNNGSNIKGENYKAGIDHSPELSELQHVPMIHSTEIRSMSPVPSESTSPSPPDLHSSRTKSRNREKPVGICKVCGDIATGKYFGALVCVPCKTFFLRYNGEGFSFVCKNKQACDISISTRIQCKYCRFQKCLAAGMTRKVRPPQVEPKEGKQLCVVCNDFGNGVHFGVVTCEGCKKFFRRGLVEHKSYVCKFNKCCPINPQTRNTCRYCRYSKCKSLGMSREAIQMGRPSKASQKQGILRPHDTQFDDSEIMDVDGSNDEKLCATHALDLSTTPSSSAFQLSTSSFSPQSPSSPSSSSSFAPRSPSSLSKQQSSSSFVSPSSSSMRSCFASQLSTSLFASSSVTSLGFGRPMADSAETLHLASSPPSFQQNTCLPQNDISTQNVPSFQLLNETQIALFQTLRLQAEGNRKNSRGILNLPKRITMSDLVATFRGNKINVSDGDDKPNSCCSRKLKDFSAIERARHKKQDNFLDNNSADDERRNEIDDFIIEHKMRLRLNITKNYWLASLSPDENLHLSDEKHLQVINTIVPNYGEFVSSSETINHNLTNSYREWVVQNGQNMTAAVVSDWIKTSVIPSFTIVSVKYFKQIPGFKSFDMTDQVKIACLGQSPSRILAAILHWFDPDINNFKDFLSWRDRIPGNTDRFKKYLIGFANNIQILNMDAIEAALLNALIIIASDYPDLIDHNVIESTRIQLLGTFRAYIATKYGSSSGRMDKLFGIIPEIRKIGFFHHEMTNKKTMMAEEFGERLLKSLNL